MSEFSESREIKNERSVYARFPLSTVIAYLRGFAMSMLTLWLRMLALFIAINT